VGKVVGAYRDAVPLKTFRLVGFVALRDGKTLTGVVDDTGPVIEDGQAAGLQILSAIYSNVSQ
jgi:hypothetical protein